jgi:Xaa-Pro aminopeptidase
MLSFNSISAVGANAAIVHYSTEEGKNETLSKNKIYLLDAGANYEDCTTDITRTHHYGTPTNEEIVKYKL